MCREFWRFVQLLPQVIARLWETFVSTPWRQCTAQRCIWWCLCCNKWLCWIALILVAILVIVFAIIMIVWGLFLLIVCEVLCIILAILEAMSRGPIPRCFAYSDALAGTSGGTGTGTGGLGSGLTTPTGPTTRTGTGTTTGTGPD